MLLALAQVLVDHVDALDGDPPPAKIYTQHLATFAFLRTADNLYQVITFEPGHRRRLSLASDHFGCEADDFHVVLLTELPCHGTEDPRTRRVAIGIDNHQGVPVEAHV